MTTDLVYLVVGAALLLATTLPSLLRQTAVSPPLVLLLVGFAVGLLPWTEEVLVTPLRHRAFLEHLTELTVVVALMGVGLAIDRPLQWMRRESWRRWGATWRLLVLAMPLTILLVALAGSWVMGLAPATALLLGAALSPTDPVLASDVQVEGPTAFDESQDEIDEEHEVRFALTSEAGLNDGMAFPFVSAAILLATAGGVSEWGLQWVAWDLVGKVVLGALVGTAVGWVLAKLAFRVPYERVRLAESGDALLALAAVLLSYAATELVHGYGFLAVFACAMTLRSSQRGHEYHQHMHTSIQRLERLLTLLVLLLLGAALSNALVELSWEGVVVGMLLVLVIRPLVGWFALWVGAGMDRAGDRGLRPGEKVATAWFGVRGVGSIYYLAFAAGEMPIDDLDQVWATVAFTIALSVLVHGVSATPVMRRLEAQSTLRPS